MSEISEEAVDAAAIAIARFGIQNEARCHGIALAALGAALPVLRAPADKVQLVEQFLSEWLWVKKVVTGEGRDSTETFVIMGTRAVAERIALALTDEPQKDER